MVAVIQRDASARSPLRVSCLIAVAVCLGGFGAMTTFWYVRPQDQSIPGHWDYVTGTLGDALVLPLLVGALTYTFVSLPASGVDPIAGSVGAALGAAGGAVVQYSWIADPSSRRNWILPAAGVFSVPGWYHAAFLLALSASITAVYFIVVARLRSADHDEVVRPVRWPLGVLSACVPLFLGLVILDSQPSGETNSSATTVAMSGVAMAAALLPLPLATVRHLTLLLPAQVVGVLLGTGLIGLVIVG